MAITVMFLSMLPCYKITCREGRSVGLFAHYTGFDVVYCSAIYCLSQVRVDLVFSFVESPWLVDPLVRSSWRVDLILSIG